MTKKTVHFSVSDFQLTRQQLLSWASQFSNCSFLDNHQYISQWNQEECLVAVGMQKSIVCNADNALQQLQQFIDDHPKEWIFGHLGYDLKNEIEPSLHSAHIDHIGFSDIFFYIPQIVVRLSKEYIAITSYNNKHISILGNILSEKNILKKNVESIDIKARMSRQSYFDIVRQLQGHILRGDCYEINFCQEFYAQEAIINPLNVYQKLSTISPNPFSTFYRNDDKYLLCASPERFLLKKGNQILSQPIKGTAPRQFDEKQLDEQYKKALQQSDKERSENVMVVDLVRNDLSKICEEGSVKVDELFGVYTYPQVHQMISTISGKLLDHITFTDIIRATYPMGSMTGAPKRRVMELIEKYERTKRGLFSGAVGYISPEGNFDFNVVIRSILYNQSAKYLSYQVGSAITFYSDAEKEYEECLLKAEAIKKVLSDYSFN